MVGTRLRLKTRVPREEASVISDASTQMELIRKETSVQVVGCSERPDLSPGAKVSPCIRCAQVEDLLHQELQETLKGLHCIRGAEKETEKWFQNHGPEVDTTENEPPWTLVTCKSKTRLQPPPSSITIKIR